MPTDDPFAPLREALAVSPTNVPLRLHLHDTRHTGVANAVAAHAAGVGTLDASIGGAGGCRRVGVVQSDCWNLVLSVGLYRCSFCALR